MVLKLEFSATLQKQVSVSISSLTLGFVNLLNLCLPDKQKVNRTEFF